MSCEPDPQYSSQSSASETQEPPVVAGVHPVDHQQAEALSDLQSPNFLHPSSIVFEALSHVRRFLFPAIIALYSAARGGWVGVSLAVMIFGGALVATVFKYFTLRYRVQGGELVVSQGLIFRRVRSVPIRRIQNVDLVQNVLHRIFDVAEVNIETASGTEPEAKLRVLTRAQIDQLRTAIFGGETQVSFADSTAAADSPPPVGRGPEQSTGEPETAWQEAQAGGHPHGAEAGASAASHSARASEHAATTVTLIHRVTLRQLVAAGLASNRGIVLFGILLGLLSQGNWGEQWARPETWRRLTPEIFQRYFSGQWSNLEYALAITGGLIVLLVILRLVGIAWYILRFYDHRLTRRGDDLQLGCGLFTRVSATVPRRRVQFISIHRPLLMRAMGLAAIRIETAGGGGAENEDATSTISRRWFMPVIAEADVSHVIEHLRPGLQWSAEEVTWQKVSPRTQARLLRLSAVIAVVAAGAGSLVAWPWGGLGGLGVFLLLALTSIKKSRAMRYANREWGAAYRSGWLNHKLSFAFFDRMQTLELHQTPFDRRWEMATLRIDTAAAGPADHVVEVRFLDANYARQQYAHLQREAARWRPEWA